MSEHREPATFLSPFDVPTPEGAEGWEEMYPYYLLFDPARREAEENRFWFYNGMHFPEPMPAFDMITGGVVLPLDRPLPGPRLPDPDRARHRASRRQRLRLHHLERGERPGARSRSGSRSSCRASASTTRTGTRSSTAGRRRSTSAIEELDGARGAAPAGARGRAGADPRPQARLELPADGRLRPLHPASTTSSTSSTSSCCCSPTART